MSQDVKIGDILIVRDGTYLIGNNCIITEENSEMLYCAGIIKIRVIKMDLIDKWLLLGLLNSYIVKRQLRTKQFTRDVIDTLGNRINEIVLPIPKSTDVREEISKQIESIVTSRIGARKSISELSKELVY